MPKGQPGTKAPHGTSARYSGHGCRCDECREAWRLYTHQRGVHRPREVVNAEREPKHGTESRYVNRRCRCEQCLAAANRARRARRAANPEVHERENVKRMQRYYAQKAAK